MTELISTISDICGILGFLVSIYTASVVVKLKQKIKGNNNTLSNIKGNVGRDFVGRDKK